MAPFCNPAQQPCTIAVGALSGEGALPANAVVAVWVTNAGAAAVAPSSRSGSISLSQGAEVRPVSPGGHEQVAASIAAHLAAAEGFSGISRSQFCTSLARRIDPPERPAPAAPAETDPRALQRRRLSMKALQQREERLERAGEGSTTVSIPSHPRCQTTCRTIQPEPVRTLASVRRPDNKASDRA